MLTNEQRMKLGRIVAKLNREKANAVHGTASPKTSFYARYTKRALDIVLSATALVITSPINVLLALATLIDVGRPILFVQDRVGKDGKTFKLYKFRNMTNECDEHGVLLPPEQRVTKLGHFVRATSLDELLNFLSVLKGDMSIIGPRPLLPEYTDRYCEYHRARLSVKPGLECPPAPGQEDVSTWEGQLNNDVWYVENMSFMTDLKKVVRLFQLALDSNAAAVRGGADRSWFMGYNDEGYAIGLYDVPEELVAQSVEEVTPHG